MPIAANYAQLRSFLQQCKRTQLDTLIKLTNLPRGGLKHDLQLRLLSYLDQDPSPDFIVVLNDLLRRSQSTESSSGLPGVPLNAASSAKSQYPGCLVDVPTPLPDSTTDSPMYLASTASNEFQPHGSGTSKRVTDGTMSFPADPWAAARGGNNNSQLSTASSVPVSKCTDSQDKTSSNEAGSKDHNYVLPNPPPGPLMTLAGVDGCFRLPATLHGFRFRESPFFKEIGVLYPPQVITPTHIGFATGRRSYDRSICLRFTADQAETITYHCRRTADDRMEFGIQVIMRFARLDPAFCSQLSKAYGLSSCRSLTEPNGTSEPLGVQESEDSLPVHLAIQVNSHPVQLPSMLPSNRPGLDGRRNPRPVNITQFLRVSPAMPNYIKLTWTHDYSSFVYSLVGVYLMHKRSPQQLCCLLKSKAFQTSESMKLELIRKLRPTSKDSLQDPKTQLNSTADKPEDDDGDDLVMPNTLPVQLLCPLSKCRIEVPVRGRQCSHVQCYDATTYLIINERKPSWNCPVCDKKAFYDDLIIDGLFLEVLNSKCTQDMDEVVFHDDGSWSVSEACAGAPNIASPETLHATESQRTSYVNSPSEMLPTPNSVVLTSGPDSVSSCSTTTPGASFAASSPAGSATSITGGSLTGVSGSPGRVTSNGAKVKSISPSKPNGPASTSAVEKNSGTQQSDAGPTIDLTGSDDEDVESSVAHSSANTRKRSHLVEDSTPPSLDPSLPRSSSSGGPVKLTRLEQLARGMHHPSYAQNPRGHPQFSSFKDDVYSRKPTNAMIPPYDLIDCDPTRRRVPMEQQFGSRHDPRLWNDGRMMSPLDVMPMPSSYMHSRYSPSGSDPLSYPPHLHSQYDTRSPYQTDHRRSSYDSPPFNHMPSLTMEDPPFWSRNCDRLN